MTYIVGIDPGENGAVAIIPAYSFRETKAFPLGDNTLSDIYLYLSELRGGETARRAQHTTPIIQGMKYIRARGPVGVSKEKNEDTSMEVYLEEPGQIIINRLTKGKDSTGAILAGATASRKLSRSVGQWEGICTALNILPTLVPPKKWQTRLMGGTTKGDKNISKNLAISIFWFLTDASGKSTITHSTADALLIALYGYLQTTNPKYIPACISKHVKI